MAAPEDSPYHEHTAPNSIRSCHIEQTDIPVGEPYTVILPLPVKVVKRGGSDFIASFEEADISIGGENFRDAFQALVLELLETFDYLDSHRGELGPWPAQQLAVLEAHLAKANR